MKRVMCVICLILLSFTAGCRSWAEEGEIILLPGSFAGGPIGGLPPYQEVPTEKAKKLIKQRILKELAKRGKIEINEVADLLEVSTLTAFRYLEELEQEGKIEQISGARYPDSLGGEYKLKTE